MLPRLGVKPLPSLTGLRGLAALWVAAYHFRESLDGQIPPFAMSVIGKGFLAVDIFFILSGFIIYLNYRWLFDDFNLGSVRAFMVARFARIYPVHFFVSLLFLLNPAGILLLSQTKDIGTRYEAGYYVMSLFLVHNWGMTDRVAWNIPSWSISTEWFAYLIFPVLLICIGRNKENPFNVIAEMAGVLAALAAICVLAGVESIGDDIPHLGLVRCVLEFVVGTGLCRFYLLAKAPSPLANGVLIAFVFLIVSATTAFGFPDFLLLPAAFALLIFCLTPERSLMSRFLTCRPILAVGEASYSIYMIHYFVKDWVKFSGVESIVPSPYLFFVYIFLVLCAGFAVYAAVESPSRQLFRNLVPKKI